MSKKKPAPSPVPESLPRLRLEYIRPSELDPNPANWRTHPDTQVKALADVIAEVGWAGAVLLNEQTGRLIDGHARKKIAEGNDEPVPVLIGSWTEEQERLILLTLDPLGAMAQADAKALEGLLETVETSSDAINAMLEELAEQHGIDLDPPPEPGSGGDEFDATPAESGPTRAQPGDLWIIGGKHRLIVGDNGEPENLSRLFAGQTFDLLFTSPPYAQQRDYGETVKELVQDWDKLMRATFGAASRYAAKDCQVLVNLGLVHKEGEWEPYWEHWIAWMRSQGWRRFGWYVWDQGSGLPGNWNGRLAPSHEFIWHFNRESIQPDKFIDKKPENITTAKSTFRGKDGKTHSMSSPNASMQTHKIPDSVIRVGRQVGSDGHPAQFPVALPEFVIRCWGGLVFDPFLGSGTTLIAAHRLGRTCYGLELEPRYADVILKRAEAEGLTVELDGEEELTPEEIAQYEAELEPPGTGVQ